MACFVYDPESLVSVCNLPFSNKHWMGLLSVIFAAIASRRIILPEKLKLG